MPDWPLRRRFVSTDLTFSNGDQFIWGTRTFVMAIMNATFDSFSGDGLSGELGHARTLATRFTEAGADIIDIGGESTRPGAEPASAQQQIDQVLPAIAVVREVSDVPISVDTSSAVVARAALGAGANMINDIHGFQKDPDLAVVAAEHGVPVVAMHNQRDRRHTDVISDIVAGFQETLDICDAAGLSRGRLVLDPGFGFGWAVEQNLEMLRRLPELWEFELPLMVGTSRKSSIGAVLEADVRRRRFGTGATVAQAICAGVDIVRVHDVVEMSEIARMTDAIVR
ncbi:MAG: dihydropteroate synthase [Candidatus Poriferisodalaceae bacterium]|jgi:dihydropteroate synthase